ncbi:hypothetical protein WJX72_007171 [[Myrmecia] bisecta]|uniref:Protein kinase domain-containing protein n=1 Tax=[Myrmecia] bisecta TaxID=41462 RepID=A0AAW1Q6J3_9CHLO
MGCAKSKATLQPADPTGKEEVSKGSSRSESMVLEYRSAPRPVDDEERLDTVHKLNPLAARTDPRFDNIVKLVAGIFKVPIAQLSVVEREWVHLIAVTGMPNLDLPRDSSFCTWTMLPKTPEVLVVEDTLRDARFGDLPQCKHEPYVRFYAGTPLVASNGHRLGNLCVVDFVPRQIDAASCSTLIDLAEMIVRSVERDTLTRGASQRCLQLATSLLRSQDMLEQKVALCDAADPAWPILFVTDQWSEATGVAPSAALGQSLWELFDKPPGMQLDELLAEQAGSERASNLEVTSAGVSASGMTKACHLSVRLAGAQVLVAGDAPATSLPADVDSNHEPLHRLCFMHLDAAGSSHSVDSTLSEGSSLSVATTTALSSPSMSRKHLQLSPSSEDIFATVLLGRLVGQGSFGRVVRGMWNGILVAVKVIETVLPAAESSQAASRNVKELLEAALCSELRHPNIVQTFNKGSLATAIDAGWFRTERSLMTGRPDMAAILTTAAEIASALAYLHSQNILHGDLTASNILLNAAGSDPRGFTAKVADFGLSRVAVAQQSAMNTGTYGTVTHMPPELLMEGKLTQQADCYAFGVLLWELWTSERPWAKQRPHQIIFALTVQGRSLTFPDDTPPAYKELGMRCLARDYAARPSFLEVVQAISTLQWELGQPPKNAI